MQRRTLASWRERARRSLALAVLTVSPGASLAQSVVPAQPIGAHALHTLTLPGSADFIALDGDDAWVTNEGRVEKLRAGAPSAVAKVRIARPCGAMAVDFGALWVVNCQDGTLVRVDLRSHLISAIIRTGVADPSGELSVATGAGSVWLLSDSTGVLSRVDPRTNAVVARIRVPAHSYAAVFGFDAVWVTTTGPKGAKSSGSVTRVDPRANRVVATIPVGPTPRFLAAGAGGVWTLNQGDGTVSRIDPATNRVSATIEAHVPGGGGDIAVGAGRVWVRASKVLLQTIDPVTNQLETAYGPPAGSGAVRAGHRVVWVTAHDIRTVWVLRAPAAGDTLDGRR